MKTKMIFTRVTAADADLVRKVCEARGEDVSDFVRRSVRTELGRLSYLSFDEKKALGLVSGEKGGDSGK